MKKSLIALLLPACCAGQVAASGVPAATHFLVTNDDVQRQDPPSTVSFFAIGQDGALAGPDPVSTGGNGMAGGFFGIDRLVIVVNRDEACVFASNAQSENIAGFDVRERKLTGLFKGTVDDIKLARAGVGLARGGDYLYATFSGSGNIAAFRMRPGCKLDFSGEVHAGGLSGGIAEGLAIRGKLMVVTYGDGSLGSFDVSNGLPVAHDDMRYAPGVREDFNPGAVDITRDGHYAIFGGGATQTEVQVADISSGRLATPTVYKLGPAWGAGSVRLSPDERLLYVSNSAGGRVTAAFFDKSTGKLKKGCTSAPLKGFYKSFTYIGAVATELPSGSGGLLYVPEFDSHGGSRIGILRLGWSSGGCSLSETTDSPARSSSGAALLSIGVYPPRPF